MGLAEVLPKLPGLLRRVREAADAALASDAAALITIDSPDFCLRVAEKVKAVRAMPVVHYVAPSVWAWRPGRAAKMARHVDHVLALLPFEPPYMEAAGMSCDFVGHPIVTKPAVSAEEIAAFRARFEGDKLLCVLPGSRSGEIKRMAPIFGAALKGLGVPVVLPTLEHRAGLVRDLVADWPVAPVITVGAENRVAMAASDVALATSGTVSLDLASVGTPMVISYRANWLTEQMIKRMVKLDSPNLINILTERLDVPEHLFEAATPENIRASLNALFAGDGAAVPGMAMEEAMRLLGRGDAPGGLRAAQSVLRFIG